MPKHSTGAAIRHGLSLALTIAVSATLLQPALPVGDPVRAAGPGFLSEGEPADSPGVVAAATLPSGFVESTVFSGLVNPTVVRFASDGRVFVAEKRGIIKVFDSLSDTTPTTFADLRTEVDDFWDRGLLGMALDPAFPATPDVYVLYARDAVIGGSAPLWNDACPTPPGPTTDGCVMSGRLSRLTANGNTAGAEQPLVNDWCQQYPSHSIGTLQFGPDGMLYVSAGDGASFSFADYGQEGDPKNPCGDPPAGSGGIQTPPTAEGGALRSQDIRTSSDPATLDGSILRLNKLTGAAAADNPAVGSSDPNVRRIVAYGMRNPFRFAFRPGTTELWVGDVGWNDYEEINRLPNVGSAVRNLGWPCYEGPGRGPSYDAANLNLCETLYAQGSGAVTAPYFSYRHDDQVLPGESCPNGSSAIAGMAFYAGGNYPSAYDGALFFADNARDCIWVVPAGGNGLPDMAQRATFVGPASNPVDLAIGPGGDLFYVDFDGGTVRRIRYVGNHAPTAVATANPTAGNPPLTVQLSASGSTDPDGDTLSYAWDLDEDGQFDDASGASTSRIYSSAGTYQPGVMVSDGHGGSDTDTVTIEVGNARPTATITTPPGGSGSTWRVGQTFSFSGTGTDPEDGTLSRFAMDWSLILHHCPSNCHTHVVQSWADALSGTFSTPDHDYPSFLELKLTVTDSGGLNATDSVQLDPRTVSVLMQSQPSGLQLSTGATTAAAPFSATLIEGGTTTVSAAPTQLLGGVEYAFAGWSDGGAATHDVTAPAGGLSLTAEYVPHTSITRLRSTDALAMAVSLSKRTYPSGAGVVYLAAGSSPALEAAAAAAAAEGGPLLMTGSWSLRGDVAAELTRLAPNRVMLVGDHTRLGGSLQNAVDALLPATSITRLRSTDALAMAVSLSKRTYPSGAGVVYLAAGSSPALEAAAAAAAAEGGPLLMTGSWSLRGDVAAELTRLAPNRVMLVGDHTRLGGSLQNAVDALLPATSITRLRSTDALAMAVSLSKRTYPSGAGVVYLAAGSSPALEAAAAAAAAEGGPLLMTGSWSLRGDVAAELTRLAPNRVMLVGDHTRLGGSLQNALSALLP